jgi:hypothetical protein
MHDAEGKVAQAVGIATDAHEFKRYAEWIPLTNRSSTDPGFNMPPPRHPWNEISKTVQGTFDKSLCASATAGTPPSCVPWSQSTGPRSSRTGR